MSYESLNNPEPETYSKWQISESYKLRPWKLTWQWKNQPFEDVSTKIGDFPLPCWFPVGVSFKFQPQQMNQLNSLLSIAENGPCRPPALSTLQLLLGCRPFLIPWVRLLAKMAIAVISDIKTWGNWKWRSSKSSTNGPWMIELEPLEWCSLQKKGVFLIKQVREPNHLWALIPASLHQSSHINKHWKLQFEQHFELDKIFLLILLWDRFVGEFACFGLLFCQCLSIFVSPMQ